MMKINPFISALSVESCTCTESRRKINENSPQQQQAKGKNVRGDISIGALLWDPYNTQAARRWCHNFLINVSITI